MFAHGMGGGREGSYPHGRHLSAPEKVRLNSEAYPSTTSVNTKAKNEETGWGSLWVAPRKLEDV